MNEIWNPIKNYETLYSISNFGQVRRDAPGRGCCIAGKILHPTINPKGYFIIDLHKDSTIKRFNIHFLVAQSFIGNRPYQFTINHKDTNKLNNISTNLEYISRHHNLKHAWENKLYKSVGTLNPQAKLTNKEVLKIHTLYPSKTYVQIGLQFGVCEKTIRNIIHRRLWKHL